MNTFTHTHLSRPLARSVVAGRECYTFTHTLSQTKKRENEKKNINKSSNITSSNRYKSHFEKIAAHSSYKTLDTNMCTHLLLYLDFVCVICCVRCVISFLGLVTNTHTHQNIIIQKNLEVGGKKETLRKQVWRQQEKNK